FIAASQFFVLLDRALGFKFFNAASGGDVLMYQHVFWFYSHPAVYIMMLPGFGIVSEIIAVKSRKPIFGYRMMAFSLLAIVGLGFTVWAHHMFTSGMAPTIASSEKDRKSTRLNSSHQINSYAVFCLKKT